MKTYAISAFVAVTTIFAPIKGALAAALVLCLIDLITGVIAAYKRGESIRSAGLGRTPVKIAVYGTALCTAFLGEKYLQLNTIVPAVNLISALIASTELLSLFENLNEISGQKLLTSIIKTLASKNDVNESDK